MLHQIVLWGGLVETDEIKRVEHKLLCGGEKKWWRERDLNPRVLTHTSYPVDRM